MICPTCQTTELMVNGMNPESGIITYVCWNPRCPAYKQAFTATGEATTTLITEEVPKEVATNGTSQEVQA